MAIKNKSKTVEDDKAFRLADKVFEEYSDDLQKVFNFFSSKASNITNGRRDVTIQVHEILELLRKANLLDAKTNDITLEDIVNMIEKYYNPEAALRTKLDQTQFDAYLAANPMLLQANEKAAAREKRIEEARKRAE